MFQDISSKKKIFKIFLTDRKNSSPINYMKWWWNFSISQKNFEKHFFAWNVLKHKVKPKNSRNSTFFSKLKFPPVFEKHLENFQDQKPMVYAINFSKSQRGKIQTPVHSVYWKGWKKNDHSVNRSVYWTNDIH